MASKAKLTAADLDRIELDEPRTQRKRPELGRYLLQVDRQTKRSFDTAEAATNAGAALKSIYPKLYVIVYDSANSTRAVIA